MPGDRCPWATSSPLMQTYHDTEWGVPVCDDRRWFEFLILEGAQAGLSWETVLRKRENYREAFAGFDPAIVAEYTERDVERLLAECGVIRNRRKVLSAIGNARAFSAVQGEFGSFNSYMWQFVGGRPIRHAFTSLDEIPNASPEAEVMSRDLRKRGFSFVGPTICYAHMQATGMVNDHLVSCFRYWEV